MDDRKNTLKILVADDDLDDQILIKKALEKSKLSNPVDFVENGEELIEYLRREGKYQHLKGEEFPEFILLDLNMPVMDGRTALKIIKEDPALRRIPVIVLTTSEAEEDIYRTYDLGVNSFITKPVNFNGLIDSLKSLSEYWFEIVKLPQK